MDSLHICCWVATACQASARMDTMILDQHCSRAWAILVENHNPVDPIVIAVQWPHTDTMEPTRVGETQYATCVPTPTTWAMAASRDIQQGQTTRYDVHAEGYSASDAKGWVTLLQSVQEMTQGKRC